MDPTSTPDETPLQFEPFQFSAEQLRGQYEVNKLVLEIKKLEKETEKADLELVELRKPSWKRPLVIAAFLPPLLGVGTLIAGYYSGWFQAESIRLENNRWDLKQDVANLQKSKVKIESERIVMQQRLDSDLARIAAERVGMEERLVAERAANESKIKFEKDQAVSMVVSVRKQAELEKRLLEDAASKMSFESLLAAFEEKNGKYANRFFGDKAISLNNEKTRLSSSNMMLSILKGNDKRAQELRNILANKVNQPSKTGDFENAVYLYILYKGTDDRSWMDKLITKSQSIIDSRRNNQDANFLDSKYFSIFELPAWSPDDEDEIGRFLVKNIRNFSKLPGKQARLLDVFAKAIGIPRGGASFLNRASAIARLTEQPKDFLYLLQLSRDIMLAPDKFPLKNVPVVDVDRLKGPINWLNTFAPAALLATITYIQANNPRPEHSATNQKESALYTYMQESALEVASNSNESEYPLNSSDDDKEEFASWLNSHPEVKLWLTPDLSSLADEPKKLKELLLAQLYHFQK